jgi:5-methylcytosine-specific restriction protein A
MPWNTSNRKQRLPNDWPAITQRIKKRDGHRCRSKLPSGKRCPRTTKLQVDHVIPGDDHCDANLATICEHHHKKKSSAEGHAARKQQFAIPLRTEGEHPGALR